MIQNTNVKTVEKEEVKKTRIQLKEEKLVDVINKTLLKKLENRTIDFQMANNKNISFHDGDNMISIRINEYNTHINMVERKKIDDWEENEIEENDNQYENIQEISAVVWPTSRRDSSINFITTISKLYTMKMEVEHEMEIDKLLELLDYK